MSIGISLVSVTKSFGARVVLNDVTHVFPPGRISALIGPNGSGKTTLMRIIARLETPDEGTVTYAPAGGEAMAPGLSLMRSMCFVSQSPVLFGMSVYNNVAYGLRLRGLDRASVRRRVEEALEAGGLSRLAYKPARTLSGGEALRASVVRAYALKPRALFVDEPTANLDPEGVALIEKLIGRMRDEFGTTVVMVTHNIFQARRLADTVCLLWEGKLADSGDNPAFFDSPRKGLTERFVKGEMVY